MKHLLLLGLLSLLFITCKEQSSAPSPSLTIVKGTGFISSDSAIAIDSTISFKVSAISNHNILKSITLSKAVNAGMGSVVQTLPVNAKTGEWETNEKVDGSILDNITYVFTVIDDNGKTASDTINISVTSKLRPLKYDTTGQKVYNFHDTLKGAFDLNIAEKRGFTDNNVFKDILDLTPFPDSTFTKSWGSGTNKTQFVSILASIYDLTNTTQDLEKEWSKQGAASVSIISDIGIGKYYMIRTNRSDLKFDIYLIKITGIVETSNDNKDYIAFSYKGG